MTSKIKVDNINKVSDDSNIINKCGTTITLGQSGDTINLASGASQTGFGRTGTVDWITGSIKTTTFTAVNGEGYFVNTTAGGITANLPAGSAGSIVAFRDYANTFDNNALTIAPNGSEKINGATDDLLVSTEGESVTLVYVDAAKGGLVVNDGNNDAGAQAEFIVATGGNQPTPGGCIVDTNYKIHTFTSPGTFIVSSAGNCAGSDKVDYLVVAGGGGGATQHSGGGGAGGFRASFPSPCGNAGTTPVSATPYAIGVGGGGARSPTTSNAPYGTNGTETTWNSIVSAGGGAAGGYFNPPGAGTVGKDGGSGGGGGSRTPGNCATQTSGGAGNTPAQSSPESPVQGHAGGYGTGHSNGGGGGGGASAVGGNAPNPGPAGAGGAGKQNNIDGNNYYWAGGGGGGSHCNSGGAGGIGGGGGGGVESSGGTAGAGGGTAINAGGAGAKAPPSTNATGGDGGDNSGGGGAGAGSNTSNAGNGGSGIVIIRYKFQ